LHDLLPYFIYKPLHFDRARLVPFGVAAERIGNVPVFPGILGQGVYLSGRLGRPPATASL
jgi:hypothetical protein